VAGRLREKPDYFFSVFNFNPRLSKKSITSRALNLLKAEIKNFPLAPNREASNLTSVILLVKLQRPPPVSNNLTRDDYFFPVPGRARPARRRVKRPLSRLVRRRLL